MDYKSKRRQTTASWDIKGISGKLVMSLKVFVNRLSHDCHINIDRDVLIPNYRSSSVFQLFNNRRKFIERTKKPIA